MRYDKIWLFIIKYDNKFWDLMRYNERLYEEIWWGKMR